MAADLVISLWNGKAGWAQKRIWVEIVPGDLPIQVRWRGRDQRDRDDTIRTNGVQAALDWVQGLIDEAGPAQWRHWYPDPVR